MTPLEFLSYNMHAGQKCTLVLNDGTRMENVFYRGLAMRFSAAGYTPQDIGDMFPAFVLPKKDGTMGRQRAPYVIFYDIKAIIFPDEKPILMHDEAATLGNAMTHMDCVSYSQILTIVKEMADLFPGKRIHFSSHDSVHVHRKDNVENHLLYFVGINDGKLTYGVKMDGKIKEVSEDSVEFISSSCFILQLLMDSIACPPDEYPSDVADDDSALCLDKMDWQDIPSADPARHPVLHKTELLELCKMHKWWKEMTDEKREEVIALTRGQIIRSFVSRFKKEPANFKEAVEAWWAWIPDTSKLIVFHGATR